MSALSYDFMQRALVAAIVVGAVAPAIGTFLVQRRQALMGDGIGHVALTGVALGFLLGAAPVLTAVVTAVAGAVAIEWLRQRGRASGDVALALLFYGGIAGGVLLMGLSDRGSTALVGYLFGSLSTVSAQDLAVVVVLGVAVLTAVALLHRQLFAVSLDEEVARVQGLKVGQLNLLVAVTAALTVTVSMRVVGLLMVSALMVVPVAAAQQVARSFRGTLLGAIAVGVAASATGLVVAAEVSVAPGAAIVVIAIGVFALAAAARAAGVRR